MTLRDYFYDKLLFKSSRSDYFIISTKNSHAIVTGSSTDMLEYIQSGKLETEVLESLLLDDKTIEDKELNINYNVITVEFQ